MRRPWRALWPLLVTFAIGLFAPEAEAIRAPRCACPEHIVLPKLGSTNVPLNTRFWVIDHTGAPGTGATSLASSPLEERLVPNTEYTRDGTRFTTGADIDQTAPTTPSDISLSITVMSQPAEHMAIDAIYLWGRYDDDTALIKVDLFDGDRETSFYTTPDRTFVCVPGVSVRPGVIRVRVRAIDLAGNESAPFTANVTTDDGNGGITSSECGEGPRAMAENRHFRCGTGDMALLFLIPIGAIGFLISIVVVRLVRNARIRRTPPVEVALLVADAVIRMMMRGQLIASALGLVAMGVALTFESRGLCVAFGLIPLISLTNWGAYRLALRRLERIDATAERRDTWLIVRDRSGESRVRANKDVFRAAVRAALPAASIERE